MIRGRHAKSFGWAKSAAHDRRSTSDLCRGGLATLRSLGFTLFTGPFLPPFLPVSLPFPLPSAPFPSAPYCLSFHSLLFSSLEVGPLNAIKGFRGAGSGAEPQRKANSVDFGLKIWHLVAPIPVIFLRSNWLQANYWRDRMHCGPPNQSFG